MENIRWRCSYRDEPQWRCWDAEDYLVFNAGSAQTHQLNQFAADILTLLKTQPLELSELINQMGSLYENLEFDAETAAYLQETMALLDNIGLIEPEMM
ncbi:MAG: HPr-rel-A system PqqD family peptide chaperone [Candidatus Competibacteraceae bacterium]|nr:HPr-rel-A system PqqD family peptide chaperone [Candidatus Competibacteraceae bacterium]